MPGGADVLGSVTVRRCGPVTRGHAGAGGAAKESCATGAAVRPGQKVGVPGVDELQQTFARSVRCWIVGQDHDASHTGGDQGVGTRRRTTVVSAGLERDVDRRIARALLRNIKRHRFGMSLAWPDVPALCDDRAIARNHAPDAGIRRSGTRATLGELERALQQNSVGVIDHAKRVREPV
jgi:hypothetical protein